MTNIIVVLPKIEDAKSIKNVLVRSGFSVMAACSTGAQALGAADALSGGIVICSYKLIDMAYSELYDYLPPGMDMLLLASPGYLSEVSVKDIVCLSMPLKVQELVSTVDMMCQSRERRRRRQRLAPRERSKEEAAIIKEAKALLMERNRMTEEEAHRYGQRHQHGGDGENGAGNKELTGVAAKGQGGYFSGKKEKIHEDKFYKNAGLRK